VLSVVPDGHTFHRHLSDTLPIIFAAAAEGDEELQAVALESAGRLVARVEQHGLPLLAEELVKAVKDDESASKRAVGARLMDQFFENTSLDVVPVLQDVLRAILPVALADEDEETMAAGMKALNSIVKKCSKEVLGSYLGDIRSSVLALITDPNTGKIDEGKLLPGLCNHNGLEPLYPIYQQGLMHGSAEARELAAKGMGELVDHTTEAALKPYVVKITGPLLRIVGDRFPGTVKKAIVETLRSLLIRGGVTLKPFLPQLQTTYVKCLSDPTDAVRQKAAESLGILVRIAARTEPLINELAKEVGTNADPAVRLSMAVALGEVLLNVPQPASEAAQDKILEALEPKAMGDDTEANERRANAWPLGITIRRHLSAERAEQVLQSIGDNLSSSDDPCRHGAALSLAAACWVGPQMPLPEQALAASLQALALKALPELLKDSDPDCRTAGVVLAAAVARLRAGTGEPFAKLTDCEADMAAAVAMVPFAYLAVRAVRHYAAAAAASGAKVGVKLASAAAARCTQAGVDAQDAERAVAAILNVGRGAGEAQVKAALDKYTGADAKALQDYASKRLGRLAQHPADGDFAWDL